MNINPRLIPCLLLKDYKFVKTTRFKNPKYIGDPINTIQIFNSKYVDELVIINIDKNLLFDKNYYCYLKDLTSECFSPLTYGGGIKNVEQAEKLFEIGFEKIIIQRLFFENKNLVKSLIKRFGSQSIIFSLDIKKLANRYFIYRKHYFFKKYSSANIKKVIEEAIDLGFGEILIQLAHLEGTREGADSLFIKSISEKVKVPLIVSGGVDSIKDIKKYLDAGADAVAAGAYFVYYGTTNSVLLSYPTEEEILSYLIKK